MHQHVSPQETDPTSDLDQAGAVRGRGRRPVTTVSGENVTMLFIKSVHVDHGRY